MKQVDGIKNIVNLIIGLTNLCEGFDDVNKSCTINAKLKVLMEISNQDKSSPSVLKEKVCLAKGNLATLCKSLIEEKLITKIKDDFDSRVIFYQITNSGLEYVEKELLKMDFNFKNQLAFKNNFKEINNAVNTLNQLIKM